MKQRLTQKETENPNLGRGLRNTGLVSIVITIQGEEDLKKEIMETSIK
jgi:hypothetical protein